MCSGCGRKPKNFRSFEITDKQRKKSQSVSYPTVKNIALISTHLGMRLTWNPVEHEFLKGYNVYRFSSATFIPKTPFNKKLLTTTEFVDAHPPKTYTAYYIIRAVFKKEKQQIEGPTSQIAFSH